MKKIILVLFVLLIAAFIYISTFGNNKKAINETYIGEWVSANNSEAQKITKTLIKNNISGCGEYYVKESTENNNEYLVACSSDGKNWNLYIVWSEIEEIQGPLSNPIINANEESEYIELPKIHN